MVGRIKEIEPCRRFKYYPRQLVMKQEDLCFTWKLRLSDPMHRQD